MNLSDRSWKERLRAAARTLRHTPDRKLHSLRRRRQLRRIQRAGLPRAILFVCHGNICRSPYAEHLFVRLLPQVLREYMQVASAGFVGPGRSSPANALITARSRGIDMQAHRAQLLTPNLVRAMDLIIVMERVQRDQICIRYGIDRRRVIVLGDLDPQPIDTRTVRDPFQQSCEVFAASYERIDRCVAELLRVITGETPILPLPPIGPAESRDQLALDEAEAQVVMAHARREAAAERVG